MPHINIQDYILDKAKTKHDKLNLLSLGSGTGDWEIGLLEKNPLKIRCELIDINDELLIGAKDYAKKHNLDLSVKVQDINKIQLDKSFYDFIVVRSSLHHFIELEHIFQQVNKSLNDGGEFIVMGEVIGRNGEKLYPETKKAAQKIFDVLPEKFRFNDYTKKIDDEVPDMDFSKNSFESIRSEEIVPLLEENFHTKECVKFDGFLSLLFDFRYGTNYDLNNNLDKSLVEALANLDLFYISNSILKPVCLFGIYSKKID